MFYEGGPQISWYQLVRAFSAFDPGFKGVDIPFLLQTHFHKCSQLFPSIGCDMFANEMAKRATTISLSILVVIEMFNVSVITP